MQFRTAQACRAEKKGILKPARQAQDPRTTPGRLTTQTRLSRALLQLASFFVSSLVTTNTGGSNQ
jgi:hypothetical protein